MRHAWIAVGLVILGGGIWAWVWLERSARAERERNVASALKAVATAEADFRANDRDGNRIRDFWTGDVAGLYHLPDPVNGGPIALIGKSIADADAKPTRAGAPPPVPYEGYVFIALEADESAAAYAQDTGGIPDRGPYYNPSKFGFCAYPSDYPRNGRWTFLINEGNTLFKVDTGGKPVTRWPEDPDTCKECLSRKHPDRECWKGKLD